jgi:hypothetical protein
MKTMPLSFQVVPAVPVLSSPNHGIWRMAEAADASKRVSRSL